MTCARGKRTPMWSLSSKSSCCAHAKGLAPPMAPLRLFSQRNSVFCVAGAVLVANAVTVCHRRCTVALPFRAYCSERFATAASSSAAPLPSSLPPSALPPSILPQRSSQSLRHHAVALLAQSGGCLGEVVELPPREGGSSVALMKLFVRE